MAASSSPQTENQLCESTEGNGLTFKGFKAVSFRLRCTAGCAPPKAFWHLGPQPAKAQTQGQLLHCQPSH